MPFDGMFFPLNIKLYFETHGVEFCGTLDPRPLWELHSEVTTAESRRENLRPPELLGESGLRRRKKKF